MFATAAVALSECGTTATPFYGSPCLTDPDACPTQQDAANDAPIPFYGGSCPGNFCPDASDAAVASDSTSTSDASDATPDSD